MMVKFVETANSLAATTEPYLVAFALGLISGVAIGAFLGHRYGARRVHQ